MTLTTKHLMAVYTGTALFGVVVALLMEPPQAAILKTTYFGYSPSYATLKTITLPWQACLFTFVNNLLADAILALGIVWIWRWRATIPALFLSLSINGFALGAILTGAVPKWGAVAVAVGIATHGIPELASYFTAAGAGLWGVQHLRLFGDSGIAHFEKNLILKENALILLKWCVPLTALAAVLETFVTPVVLTTLSGVGL